jgi:Domain of unknown function (DUF6456)
MPETNQTNNPSGAEMVRLLARLSRKGALLHRADGAGAYDIMQAGQIRSKSRDDATARISADVVSRALDQGWLQATELEHQLRLSEAGAVALRRGLAAPPAQPAAVTAATTPAQTTTRAPKLSATLSPVARLHRQRSADGQTLISTPELEAAERLERDFMQGQMMPRVTSNWDKAALGMPLARGSGATDVADHVSAAQERVRRALADAGPEFADLLIDTCCLELGIEACEHQRGWPPRSGKILLKMGLGRLARHYGMVARGPTRSGRIGHWGTTDYRPELGPH